MKGDTNRKQKQILQRKRSAHDMRLNAMQQNERNTALYEAILRLNTLEECISFLTTCVP